MLFRSLGLGLGIAPLVPRSTSALRAPQVRPMPTTFTRHAYAAQPNFLFDDNQNGQFRRRDVPCSLATRYHAFYIFYPSTDVSKKWCRSAESRIECTLMFYWPFLNLSPIYAPNTAPLLNGSNDIVLNAIGGQRVGCCGPSCHCCARMRPIS